MSAPRAIDESTDAIANGTAAASAADRVERLIDLATPFAVRAVASLRVPDLIKSGTRRLADLAAAAGAHPDALGRLLRYLVHRGVFVEQRPGEFGLTELGELLCDHGPADKRNWLDFAGLGMRMDLAYTGLLHSVRTGREAYTEVHGHSFWADLDADPRRQLYADGLMTSQHEITGPQVARLYDWGSVRTVMDVGGGSGALLATVLRAHPHLRGTLIDRPVPARLTAARLAGTDLAGRVEVAYGDFFSPLPPGGDVYVVSRAISDWDDAEAAAILRRCGEAAGRHGRVLIVEVLPTTPHVPHLAPFDLQMLVVVGGRERSVAGFEALADTAGLSVTSVLHGRDGLMLIECAAGCTSAEIAPNNGRS